MAMSEELRVSDGERDGVVEFLKEQTAQGRLSLEEFEQRTGDAYAAKTRLQLEQVTQDLPGAPDLRRDQREPIADEQCVPARAPSLLSVIACCCWRPRHWRS